MRSLHPPLKQLYRAQKAMSKPKLVCIFKIRRVNRTSWSARRVIVAKLTSRQQFFLRKACQHLDGRNFIFWNRQINCPFEMIRNDLILLRQVYPTTYQYNNRVWRGFRFDTVDPLRPPLWLWKYETSANHRHRNGCARPSNFGANQTRRRLSGKCRG